MTLAECGMPSISSIFAIPKVQDAFDLDGTAKDPAFERRVSRFLDEFEWYQRALKAERARGTPY